MAQQSRQRRKGVRPHRTLWTEEAVQIIDAYQAQHQIPSFSAAAETLVRLGIQQSPTEVITPIVTSAVRHAVHRELDRLIRLQIYTAIEAGIGQRLAGAAVRDLGRLKQDDPERYEKIKAAAVADARRRLARNSIGEVVADLYAELMATDALLTSDAETDARREA
jgi:hypothetical protein